MFKTFIEWIKGLAKRITDPNESLPDVAVSSDMQTALELWAQEYEKPTLPSLRLAAGVSKELATAVTLEFKSEITGSKRADYLNEQYKKVLKDLRINTEYACAKGGLVFKPYPDEDQIHVQAIQADRFFPVAFDSNGDITSAYFVEQFTKGDQIYTRIELHEFTPESYTVKNFAYVSKYKQIKGTRISLDAVPEWADILPEAEIRGAEFPLFSYFKMPFANTIDPTSPLGISVFARALNNIKDADRMYDSFLWEFQGSELAVTADESLFYLGDKSNELRLPKGHERLYRPVGLVGNEDKISNHMDTFSPNIREASYINGLNALKQTIEFNCGLAYGTISDPQQIDRTATEIKLSKQRSYATVSDIQKALQRALDHLIYAMDYWVDVMNLAPAGTWEVNYAWDDSIVMDAETERSTMLAEVAQGIRSPESYLMTWYGVSEEEARAMMPALQQLIQ